LQFVLLAGIGWLTGQGELLTQVQLASLLPFVEQLDVKFFSSCNHATLLMELQQLQRQD
jgi:hypothetical protein